MHHERLSPVDTSFLYLESDHEPQHVGSLSYLEGGPLRGADGRLRIDDLRARIVARLHQVPRLRQRLMEVPFGIGRPIWVDDDTFDIGYHVRVTAVPAPGDTAQVHDLMGRVQSIALDRSKPLWEMWFVDGLAGDEVGLIIKTHHAMGDGIANVDLVMTLVDTSVEAPVEPDPPDWLPDPPPSRHRLLFDTAIEQGRRPLELSAAGLRALRSPRRVVADVADMVGALWTFGTDRPPVAPWNVPVGRSRRWSSAAVPIDTVEAIRTRTDMEVTINDVVLAVCARALCEFLCSHDRPPVGPLRAMVPVSRREVDQHGDTLGNLVSMMLVDLPADEVDPDALLEEICTSTRQLKASGVAAGAEHLLAVTGLVPQLYGPLARFASSQVPMNLIITNIPGPPVPLYVDGARVLRAYPYVEVIDREGLTIAVLSYEGYLFFGITGDLDVLADIDDLAAAIERSAAALCP